MPRPLKIVSKKSLEPLIKDGFSVFKIAKALQVGLEVISRCLKAYGLKTMCDVRTPEGRKTASDRKKKWLTDNPDKHPWRHKDKFKSVPCETLKEWLYSQGIDFVEEFMPLVHMGRNYSVDIAFPNKLIAIEVNGNQHYNADGTLKSYYQERHDLIEQAGWKVYELHYSVCFRPAELVSMIPTILGKETSSDCKYGSPTRIPTGNTEVEAPYDMRFHHGTEKQLMLKLNWPRNPKPKKIYYCRVCNDETKTSRQRCMSCSRLASRKVTRPSKEDLQEMVWTTPSSKIAKGLGVADTVIGKWCREYRIEKPPKGYWARRGAGLSHDEAMIPIPQKMSKPLHRITPEIANQAKRLRQEGKTWTQISHMLGFYCGNLRKACRE